MISINNLSIHFGGHYLFDNVSFNVDDTDRVGLIGRNGTGKTTLMKILADEIKPEQGSMIMPNIYTLGYLPQEVIVDSERILFDEVSSALHELETLEARIESITEEISNRTDYESKEYTKLIEELTDANERFSHLGGHAIEGEVERILRGLGFVSEDFTKKVNEFSGGWQMRMELAKILLRAPNCILLDEPTNHLDIESIAWLEDFLKNYYGAVIIISHDRSFLDSVTNRTIEISNSKVYSNTLAYTKFIEYRKAQKEQEKSAYNNQQRQIAQTERFIERFRAKATFASRVQSRVKQLEKVERIELDHDEIKAMNLVFPEPPRSGRLIVEADKLSKRYDDNLVLKEVTFAIERGEKIAFVGKNGEGKSTLAKIFSKLEDHDGGLKFGSNIELGYFAQHQTQTLDESATVFEVIDNVATGSMRTQVRNLLGAFLFSGDSIYKRVKVLSGGEKSRLAIARLLLQPINFLVMDEPTNHLDMTSKDVLKNALMQYSGAMIIVSHDRDFLQGLTTKTIEFKNKNLKEHLGDINVFLEKQRLNNLNELEMARKVAKLPKKVESGSSAQSDREKKKAVQREENRLKKVIAGCEKDIAYFEEQIAKLDKLFADPTFFEDVKKATKKQAEHKKMQEKLERRMEEWSAAEEELGKFDAN